MLEEKEKSLVEKENKYINDISLCIEKFKKFHTGYAETVNSKPEFRSSDLEFSVCVPFKKDAFLDKISRLLDNRSIIFKKRYQLMSLLRLSIRMDFLKDII